MAQDWVKIRKQRARSITLIPRFHYRLKRSVKYFERHNRRSVLRIRVKRCRQGRLALARIFRFRPGQKYIHFVSFLYPINRKGALHVPDSGVSLSFPDRYLAYINPDEISLLAKMDLRVKFVGILMLVWDNHLEISIAMDLEELLWLDNDVFEDWEVDNLLALLD